MSASWRFATACLKDLALVKFAALSKAMLSGFAFLFAGMPLWGRNGWGKSLHLLRGSDVSIVELRLAPGTAVVMSGVSMLLIDGVLLILGVPEPVVD